MTSESAGAVMAGCRVLEWDSDFFARRIVRVDAAALRTAGADAIDAWCAGQQAECAYLLVDADDQHTTDIAQASGFRLVDVRITLTGASTRGTSEARPGQLVRPVEAGDVVALRAIARRSHVDTRFYADRHFDRGRCDDLYDLWVEKSCDGWADRVFVAERNGAAVGYVTCHLRADDGQIGLVGVDPGSRGHGCGGAMIGEALRWFAQQGRSRVTVVTQGRNAAGLRLYQRAGLFVSAVQLSFHRWFSAREP